MFCPFAEVLAIDCHFSLTSDVIDEGEEIYFDITHGLRNIPMLVMAILEYAKVTKGILIGGIYYGAFEVDRLHNISVCFSYILYFLFRSLFQT